MNEPMISVARYPVDDTIERWRSVVRKRGTQAVIA